MPSQSRATTVYASQAGASLDSNVLTGGGTDDTSALQVILDRASTGASLHLVIDGAALVRGLNVHSNTTIECPNPSCGFFLADWANRAILRNANPSKSEIVDRNITILGGTYNNNRLRQVHHTDENEWVTAMDFFGIEQLTLRDVVIRDQRTFAMFLSNWRRVHIEHIDILLTDRGRAHSENTDGLHFCGPGQFLTLRDIQGCTYDDFIALNADDGHTSYNDQGILVNNGDLGPYASFGDITDVLIDGVVLDEAAQGIRFLSRTSRIDRVVVRNVIGTYLSFGFFMDTFTGEPGGNYGHITFDTIDLRPLPPNYDYMPPFLFSIGGRHDSITIRNMQHRSTDDRRLILVERDADVGALSIDGLDITADKALGDPRYVIVEGHVDRLRLRGVQATHPANAPPAGCMIETSSNDSTGVCRAARPPAIGHLILENVATRHLAELVRHRAGHIGRVAVSNVTALDAPGAPFTRDEGATVGEAADVEWCARERA